MKFSMENLEAKELKAGESLEMTCEGAPCLWVRAKCDELGGGMSTNPDGSETCTVAFSQTDNPEVGSRDWIARKNIYEQFRLPGDTDGDGDVDFTDFLKLSENFGRETNAAFSDGDFDFDGRVAFSDFLLLSSNFSARDWLPEPTLAEDGSRLTADDVLIVIKEIN